MTSQVAAADHSHIPANRHDPVPLCMAKKWVPLAHRHGCAIYWHHNVSTEQRDCVGGELMVSCIIKGTPQQCLDALLSSRCGNSILGPSTDVQVLEEGPDAASKVLQLSLASLQDSSSGSIPSSSSSRAGAHRHRPMGVLSWLCSRLMLPRCALVHQRQWKDSSGIHCIMFHSLTQDQAAGLQQQQQQQQQQPAMRSNGVANGFCADPTLGTNSNSSSDSCCHVHMQAGSLQQQPAVRQKPPAVCTQPSRKQQQAQQVQLQASCCHHTQHKAQQHLPIMQQHMPTGQQHLPTGQQQGQHGLPKQQQQQQAYQHRQQQRQQQQPVTVTWALWPLAVLINWLYTIATQLASLVGPTRTPTASSSSSSSSRTARSGGSSSSSSSWLGALCGPVMLDVVGGFTVAGLETDDGAAGNCETLVTSILKVDLGGCLSSSSSAGSCCGLVACAAARLGVTDLWVQQLVSAVERVKHEVEQPHTAADPQQQQQQQQVSSAQPVSSLGVVQGLVPNLASLASLALAPLTAWQTQRQQQPRSQHHSRRQQQQQQQHTSHGVAGHASAPGRLGGGSSGSWGGAGVHAAGSSGGSNASSPAADLVGLDQLGRPLTGLCNPAFWAPLHQPGCPALFQVRGPSYLHDHVKVCARDAAYTLLAVDLVSTATAVHHLARFLPSVRRSRAGSCFVINMMVPAAHDVMNLVMTFGSSTPWPVACSTHPISSSSSSSSQQHRGGSGSSSGSVHAAPGRHQAGGVSADGAHPVSSSSTGGGTRPTGGSGSGSNATNPGGSSSDSSAGDGFQHALRRFLLADSHERSNMFKMIPHIEVGPWVLQQMVGTTPVIMGRKLETTYHLTDRYMEVDIDVTTCRTAGFIVQSIRGATTSLVVDLCYLLEGRTPQELPEQLIGAVRFSNIDMSATTALDTTTEIPPWPQPW